MTDGLCDLLGCKDTAGYPMGGLTFCAYHRGLGLMHQLRHTSTAAMLLHQLILSKRYGRPTCSEYEAEQLTASWQSRVQAYLHSQGMQSSSTEGYEWDPLDLVRWLALSPARLDDESRSLAVYQWRAGLGRRHPTQDCTPTAPCRA